MRIFSIILLMSLFVGCTTSDIEKENTKNKSDELGKIAILGTFHFDVTNDYSSVQIDSLYSNRRQNELEQLVQKIKEYNPTKILVEWEPNTKSILDENFKKYINGDFVLPKNEIYQIGFRLAKETGINEFFPVDYQMDLGDNKLVEYLNKINKFSDFENLLTYINKTATKETEYLKSHSIIEYYTKINSNESDNFNKNIYIEKISSISNEPGNPLLEYTSNWYKRNIFIMGQIDTHITKEDRILLIIGAGHRAILKDFYMNRSNVEYVEISEYLK